MIKFGIHPINWSNDDFKELGGDISLETCLSEMSKAGFEGCELGHKFPRSSDELRVVLQKENLKLVSGWHSTFLLENSFEKEIERIDEHIKVLEAQGCDVLIICECTKAIHSTRGKSLNHGSFEILTETEWQVLTRKLNDISKYILKRGMKPVYHYHMGTIIQTEEHIHRLMKGTQDLGLLLDTGHLMFAGGDPLSVYKKFKKRVFHIHAKNVRKEIVEKAKIEKWDFCTSVKNGVFTVPGDAGMDYSEFFNELKKDRYHGWVVVEAEQNPRVANPLKFAKLAKDYLNKHFNKRIRL